LDTTLAPFFFFLSFSVCFLLKIISFTFLDFSFSYFPPFFFSYVLLLPFWNAIHEEEKKREQETEEQGEKRKE